MSQQISSVLWTLQYFGKTDGAIRVKTINKVSILCFLIPITFLFFKSIVFYTGRTSKQKKFGNIY